MQRNQIKSWYQCVDLPFSPKLNIVETLMALFTDKIRFASTIKWNVQSWHPRWKMFKIEACAKLFFIL